MALVLAVLNSQLHVTHVPHVISLISCSHGRDRFCSNISKSQERMCSDDKKEFGFVAGVDVPQEPMSVPLEHLESMCQTRRVLKGNGRYQCDPGSVDR